MGVTMAEKILARTSGRTSVVPGEYVTTQIDRVMAHGSAPDSAGRNIINPTATRSFTAMTLHHLEFAHAARRLERTSCAATPRAEA
jgi:isocitrate/isopropylmalate dehydrogenase